MSTVGDVVAGLTETKIANLHPVVIAQNTSWSCHHGLSRWSHECGCSTDGAWKRILRSALNDLAPVLDDASESALKALGLDIWDLRDRYVVVAAGYAEADDFAAAALAGSPWADDPTSVEIVRDLLAAQRSRLAMFTSCGWFWDDPSRQETLSCLIYAADAIEKVRRLTGVDAGPTFEKSLVGFRSRVTFESGDALYGFAAAELPPLMSTQENADTEQSRRL
jgi:hypothetical protein